MLLLGVQGCGKSLAAKAPAGRLRRAAAAAGFRLAVQQVPRRDRAQFTRVPAYCGSLEPLRPMARRDRERSRDGPRRERDGAPRSRRPAHVDGRAQAQVFLVATANDVDELPPELVRKGRFDEIFFVDLPTPPRARRSLAIHLRSAGWRQALDLPQLVTLTDGFSGAEIEQGIVSSLYAAHASGHEPELPHFIAEFRKTRPLSVVMAERVAALRDWARGRTVPAE